MAKKWDSARFIPYLQAHTNTYAPIEKLREIYNTCLSLPDVCGFAVAYVQALQTFPCVLFALLLTAAAGDQRKGHK